MNLFDEKARALRLRRALRRGPELFLHERAFNDVMERLELVQRSFRRALLIGSLSPQWRDRLLDRVAAADVVGTGQLSTLEPGAYDLGVVIGELDCVNDLPRALLMLRFALRQDSLFIGAVPGGDTLPALRAAMRAADLAMGSAVPHVHPRLEPASLAALLSDAGFTMPVVDVDSVEVSYRSFSRLVGDLRSMGATNVLAARPTRPLTRTAAAAAARAFEAQASPDGRIRERFDILHFAAWTPHEANG